MLYLRVRSQPAKTSLGLTTVELYQRASAQGDRPAPRSVKRVQCILHMLYMLFDVLCHTPRLRQPVAEQSRGWG